MWKNFRPNSKRCFMSGSLLTDPRSISFSIFILGLFLWLDNGLSKNCNLSFCLSSWLSVLHPQYWHTVYQNVKLFWHLSVASLYYSSSLYHEIVFFHLYSFLVKYKLYIQPSLNIWWIYPSLTQKSAVIPTLRSVSAFSFPYFIFYFDLFLIFTGVEFGARMINIDGKQIKLQIWDTVSGN